MATVPFPTDRPETYDPAKVWDSESGTWKAVTTADGARILKAGTGRYGNKLIAVGFQSIYVEDY